MGGGEGQPVHICARGGAEENGESENPRHTPHWVQSPTREEAHFHNTKIKT